MRVTPERRAAEGGGTPPEEAPRQGTGRKRDQVVGPAADGMSLACARIGVPCCRPAVG